MKNKKNISIAIGIAVILFFVGFLVGKSSTSSVTSNTTRQLGAAAVSHARQAGAGLVSGTVLSQNSDGFSLQTSDGGSRVVLTSSSTQVLKSTMGSLSDVTPGSNISIGGTVNADGTVTADFIQLRPAGVGAQGFGARSTNGN